MSRSHPARDTLAGWIDSLDDTEVARLERLIAEYVTVIVTTLREDHGLDLPDHAVIELTSLLAYMAAEVCGVDLGADG